MFFGNVPNFHQNMPWWGWKHDIETIIQRSSLPNYGTAGRSIRGIRCTTRDCAMYLWMFKLMNVWKKTEAVLFFWCYLIELNYLIAPYWDDHLLWLKQQHFRPQRWYCILVEFSWSEVIELREKTPWLCFDCEICRLAELHHQAAVIRQDFVIPGHTVTWDGA